MIESNLLSLNVLVLHGLTSLKLKVPILLTDSPCTYTLLRLFTNTSSLADKDVQCPLPGIPSERHPSHAVDQRQGWVVIQQQTLPPAPWTSSPRCEPAPWTSSPRCEPAAWTPSPRCEPAAWTSSLTVWACYLDITTCASPGV